MWTQRGVQFFNILHYGLHKEITGANERSLGRMSGSIKAFKLLTPTLNVLLAPHEGSGTHLAFI